MKKGGRERKKFFTAEKSPFISRMPRRRYKSAARFFNRLEGGGTKMEGKASVVCLFFCS